MYEFSPTRDQERVLERVRALMDELVYPHESETVPHRGLLRQLQARVKAERLWAAHLPAEAGRLGMGNVTLGLINEQLGRSPIAPRVFGTSAPDTGNTEILWLAATPDQKQKYLDPLVADDVRSCIAMTEPEVSGSDPTQIRSTAIWDGDAWVINDHKWFITNARGSAFAIVFANTDPSAAPHRRASMFIVETDTPGYELVREVPVMGDQSEGGHCELRFVDCRVAAANLLGERGGGFALAQARLGAGRITHCMRWIGVAQRAFELMLARATERETLQDSPLEGWYREARAARIYDGPDEVHRMVVARQILRQFAVARSEAPKLVAV